MESKESDKKDNLLQRFLKIARTYPDRSAIRFKKNNKSQNLTYAQVHYESRYFSYALIKKGLKEGGRVGILSSTRFEWTISDVALLGSSAISVPLDCNLSDEDLLYILKQTQCSGVIVENKSLFHRCIKLKAQDEVLTQNIKFFVVIDTEGLSGEEDFFSFSQCIEEGVLIGDEYRSLFEKSAEATSLNSIFSIVYTSGTTGIPKGVSLSHGNMIGVLDGVYKKFSSFFHPEGERIYSCVPYTHIFGRVELYASLFFGFEKIFFEDCKEAKPTLLFAVPSFFEKLYFELSSNKIVIQQPKKLILTPTQLKDFLKRLSNDWILDKFKNPIRAAFGGELKFAFSGGSSLHSTILEFFSEAGVLILEGYGLTETCGPIALNYPEELCLGSVGKVLDDVEVKLTESGEILVKAPCLFQGYWSVDQKVNRSKLVENDWFATGDYGFLDHEGFLHVVDRKKDVWINTDGVHIAPQKIEKKAQSISFIQDFIVCGESQKFLSALITLKKEEVLAYARETDILFSEYEDLTRHPKVRAKTQALVDQLNQELSGFEKIKKFMILPKSFDILGGELTVSMKIKRRQVYEKYKAYIGEMYE